MPLCFLKRLRVPDGILKCLDDVPSDIPLHVGGVLGEHLTGVHPEADDGRVDVLLLLGIRAEREYDVEANGGNGCRALLARRERRAGELLERLIRQIDLTDDAADLLRHAAEALAADLRDKGQRLGHPLEPLLEVARVLHQLRVRTGLQGRDARAVGDGVELGERLTGVVDGGGQLRVDARSSLGHERLEVQLPSDGIRLLRREAVIGGEVRHRRAVVTQVADGFDRRAVHRVGHGEVALQGGVDLDLRVTEPSDFIGALLERIGRPFVCEPLERSVQVVNRIGSLTIAIKQAGRNRRQSTVRGHWTDRADSRSGPREVAHRATEQLHEGATWVRDHLERVETLRASRQIADRLAQ